jgi:RNA polymerase sigma-70 factor (ECF subfamily)
VTVPPIDDADLAAGIRRGDPEAWTELCERFGGALYLYAFHLAGGEGAWAEDIRQETLLAAASAVRRYRGDAPLFGWLCSIARRKAADELRRRGRLADPPEDEDPSSAFQARIEGEPLPEELLEKAEIRARTVEALWSLPPDYRQLLIARYVEEVDVEALARRFGRTYKATESMLSRARTAMRRQWKEIDHGESP